MGRVDGEGVGEFGAEEGTVRMMEGRKEIWEVKKGKKSYKRYL